MSQKNKRGKRANVMEFPVEPSLRDLKQWAHNVGIVALLCGLGTVTEWLDGSYKKDTYTHIPYKYEIDEIKIEFLPHWGFYKVGGMNLDVPAGETDIRVAVELAKELASLKKRAEALGFERCINSNVLA